MSYLLVAQQKTVDGRVTDADNKPIEGASIHAQGEPTVGALTDVHGRFSIEVSIGDTLIFSSIGYQTKKIGVGSSANINVTLQPSKSELNEIVVIGYGAKKKGELTGAVSKVNSKVFEDRPLTNSVEALQGALPGVLVTKGSGRPGDQNYSLNIRGASSINGNQVLVLIDGIPGDLNSVNPNDIKDITVLKDGAAAIYGARAADGVVLVTTKEGEKGEPTISYSGNYGWKIPQFLKTRTNTLQYAEMYDNGMKNVGLPGVSQEVFDKIKENAPPDPVGWLKFLENFPGFYGSHNWNDAVYGVGIQQMHNISISGAGDKNSYYFSAGYRRNEGIFKHGEDHSDHYNLRMNYDFKLFDKIDFETSTSFEKQKTIEPTALPRILYFVNQMGSYVPIYNPSGQFYKYQGGFRNPVQYLEQAGLNTSDANQFVTNLKGEIPVLNGLKLIGQMGIKIDFRDGKTTHPTFPQHNWDGSDFDIVNDPNSANFYNSKNLYQNYTAYLEYNKTILDKHTIGFMAGASREKNHVQGQSITGYNFSSNDIFTLNLADRTKTEYADFTGNSSSWALQSYFGRFSYNFDGKYLLDFTLRMDGSSKFAKSKRWSALFPSLSAAWNLSDEDFIKSLNTFDNFKIRLSWGKAGNQQLSFGDYDYISLITISGEYPLGQPNVGLPGAVSSIASENRTWETIITKNIGLDFAFLDSRLTGSFNYYIKNNNDMLVEEGLPATLGGTAPTQNIGKLRTEGWDFSIGWSGRKGDFNYSVSAMISDSKNKLIALQGNDSYGEGLVRTHLGYPINSYFGYDFQGLIQNEKQLNEYKKLNGLPAKISIGDVMYKDVDGDGKITAFGDPKKGTKGDLVYLGDLNPRYIYSADINLSFKRFDLRVFLQGVGMRSGVRTGEIASPLRWVWMEPLQYFYGKTWTPDNKNAKYPRIIPGAVGADEIRDWDWRYSSMRLNNLAYLKLKVLTLGYNLPQSFLNKAKIKNARVYISGQDLITLSKDTWGHSFSPEETWERSDEQTYPFNGVVSFGLDLKF